MLRKLTKVDIRKGRASIYKQCTWYSTPFSMFQMYPSIRFDGAALYNLWRYSVTHEMQRQLWSTLEKED